MRSVRTTLDKDETSLQCQSQTMRVGRRNPKMLLIRLNAMEDETSWRKRRKTRRRSPLWHSSHVNMYLKYVHCARAPLKMHARVKVCTAVNNGIRSLVAVMCVKSHHRPVHLIIVFLFIRSKLSPPTR